MGARDMTFVSLALPHNSTEEMQLRVLFFEESREFDKRGQPPVELGISVSRLDSMEALHQKILLAAIGKSSSGEDGGSVGSLILVELGATLMKSGRHSIHVKGLISSNSSGETRPWQLTKGSSLYAAYLRPSSHTDTSVSRPVLIMQVWL